jgi:hypothetical protein
MGLFGFSAKAGVNPFQYALDRTRETFFGPSAAAPSQPGAKGPPRTFGGDMRTAVNDSLTQQYGGGLLAAINPANAAVAANKLINGTIHAGAGSAGAALYHHGIEATTLPEAMQRGLQAVPRALIDPAGAVVDGSRIFFKRRTGPETAQGLARTQNRAELAGQGAFMAATAPLGAGDVEVPVAAADFGPELANILSRIGNRISNGAGVTEEAAHNQALAYIVQALKKDGATPEQFAGIIKKWTEAGSDAPSLVDALSGLANKGQQTRQVVMDAIPRTELGADTAADYLAQVGGKIKGRVRNVVDSLKPNGASYADLTDQGDAASFARQTVNSELPEFQNGLAKYGIQPTPEGTDAVQNAMQAGAYDYLRGVVGQGRQAMGEVADWSQPSSDISQNLRTLFGDKVDLFNQRAANEATRWSNANRLNLGFNPAASSVPEASMGVASLNAATKLPPNAGAQALAGAGLRQLIPGTLKTDAELANIAKIATGPADAIANLPMIPGKSLSLPVRAFTLPAAAAHVASVPALTGDGGGGQTPASVQPSSAPWPPFALWQ